MALVSCPNCGMQVSEYVRKCPYCGENIKQEHSSPENRMTDNLNLEADNGSETTILSTFYLKAAGVTHEGRQAVVKRLQVGERLIFIPDPSNPYDDHAVRIQTASGEDVGFIPKDKNQRIFETIMNHTREYYVVVAAVTGGGSYSYGVNLKVEEQKSEPSVCDQLDVASRQKEQLKRAWENEKTGHWNEAIRMYEILAAEHNPDAQFRLGMCYRFGEGVPKDETKAIEYLLSSAKGGNKFAQCEVGAAYFYGQGVNQDYCEAVKWLKESADKGNLTAMHNYAYCLLNGCGCEKNEPEAFNIFKTAATYGYADSQYMMGLLLKEGIGATKNINAAREWLQKSAIQGQKDAKDLLSSLNFGAVEESANSAIDWTAIVEFSTLRREWSSINDYDMYLWEGAPYRIVAEICPLCNCSHLYQFETENHLVMFAGQKYIVNRIGTCSDCMAFFGKCVKLEKQSRDYVLISRRYNSSEYINMLKIVN